MLIRVGKISVETRGGVIGTRVDSSSGKQAFICAKQPVVGQLQCASLESDPRKSATLSSACTQSVQCAL